jgi:hypothetical protein
VRLIKREDSLDEGIIGGIRPMEALMNRGSYSFKPTPEDILVIQRWKLRLAALYSAILLMLVIVLLAGRNPDGIETVKYPGAPGLSAASAVGDPVPH